VPVRQRFPRARRLRKRPDFLAAQTGGRRHSTPSYLVFVRRRVANSSMAAGARFGITVTRKVGNAVTRNRIKRVLRETCRRSGERFPADADVVFVARPSAVARGLGDAMAEVDELLRKMNGKMNGQGAR
jgi:ribonuclease P protein component